MRRQRHARRKRGRKRSGSGPNHKSIGRSGECSGAAQIRNRHGTCRQLVRLAGRGQRAQPNISARCHTQRWATVGLPNCQQRPPVETSMVNDDFVSVTVMASCGLGPLRYIVSPGPVPRSNPLIRRHDHRMGNEHKSCRALEQSPTFDFPGKSPPSQTEGRF